MRPIQLVFSLFMGLFFANLSFASSNIWSQIHSDALIVDVRSAEEFKQGHLPGAVLIPHDQLAQRIEELGQNKQRQVVLYCRSGRRSGLALDILKQQGFNNAINAGGYQALLESKP